MGIVLGILGIGIVIVLLVLYSSFAWGYVASVIYKWFILSQFSELPALDWWQLAGIMFFVNCFVHNSKTHIKKEFKDENTAWGVQLLAPWMVLLGSWIFKIIFF